MKRVVSVPVETYPTSFLITIILITKPTIFHCTHSNAICHTGLLTACEQDQDGTSWSWSCSQAVWHIPLLCVQWKTPDDGQRNYPKHVEFSWFQTFAVFWILYVFFWVFPQASECCLPTFRNPLSVPSSRAECRVWSILYIQPLKMELIEGSETSANNNRTPGKYPKEYIKCRVLFQK